MTMTLARALPQIPPIRRLPFLIQPIFHFACRARPTRVIDVSATSVVVSGGRAVSCRIVCLADGLQGVPLLLTLLSVFHFSSLAD